MKNEENDPKQIIQAKDSQTQDTHKQILNRIASIVDGRDGFSIQENAPFIADVIIRSQDGGQKPRFFLLRMCELPNYQKIIDCNEKFFDQPGNNV